MATYRSRLGVRWYRLLSVGGFVALGLLALVCGHIQQNADSGRCR